MKKSEKFFLLKQKFGITTIGSDDSGEKASPINLPEEKMIPGKVLHFKKLWGLVCLHVSLAAAYPLYSDDKPQALKFHTTTPIKYAVVIIPENASFDHFFATYPNAENPSGEPHFKAKRNTPTVNGLNTPLFDHNNNLIAPFRLDRSQAAVACDPSHSYTNLQKEAHAGLMDQIIQSNPVCHQAMGYFDGNTVTALWNYAQRFAMSDNCFSTNIDPSAPGHINIVSGQTHGTIPPFLGSFAIDGTLIGDANPVFDDCSKPPVIELTGMNIGNLLNAKKITWGYFQGGFADCSKTHIDSFGVPLPDYTPHHEPFQYYSSTSNPAHLPPSSKKKIGYQDQANHQYDINDFWTAARHHNIPAVSFLKPPAYQNGHPGKSDPLALQTFLVKTINRLQRLPEWKEMAIFILWDDSGGWYDHVIPPIINQSQSAADAWVSPGNAGSNPPLGDYQARLGYGLRVPFLIISPFVRQNYVDHTVTDQTSVLRFIEDNWKLGRIGDFSFDALAGSLMTFFDFKKPNFKPLILHSSTGVVARNKS